MGHEEFEDGDMVATCNDDGVEVDWLDNQLDMDIGRAMRFRDWLNRVLPSNVGGGNG